jgi:hypothetical protein
MYEITVRVYWYSGYVTKVQLEVPDPDHDHDDYHDSA